MLMLIRFSEGQHAVHSDSGDKMNSVSRCTPLAVVVVILLMLNQCSHVKGAKHWRVAFDRFIPPMEIGEEKIVNFMLLDLNKIELQESSATIRVVSGDSDVVDAYKEIPVSEINDGKWNGSVRLEAVFLGGTEISVKIGRQIENKWFIERSKGFLPIQVIRIRVPMWMYDEIYNIFEHALYITIGIILGMAIDWHKVGANLRKPVGVGISFFCSYVFMPLVCRITAVNIEISLMFRTVLLFQYKDRLCSWIRTFSRQQ